MELLDIVDQYGNPTGETIERSIAHEKGIWHRTSHVWIYRVVDSRAEILLQKRCAQKDSFPGCYDISSAGHIPAGDDYETSAVREMQEELGVTVSPEQLLFCGMRTIVWDEEFHGKPYHDRQVSKIFLLKLQGYEEQDFTLQESEIDSVRWMDWKACIEAVRQNQIPHCIEIDELALLKNAEPMMQIDL